MMHNFSKASVGVVIAYVSFITFNIVNINAVEKNQTSANVRNIAVLTKQNAPTSPVSAAVKIASTIKDQIKADHRMTPHAPDKKAVATDSNQLAKGSKVASTVSKFANKRSIPQAQAKLTSQPNKDKTKPQQSTQSSNSVSSSNFSQVTTYLKTSDGKQKPTPSSNKMALYAEPDKKGKIVSEISVTENFTAEQGDWVKVTTKDGKVGWALIKDVEKNINEAWNAEYQVIINGPSSKYSVTKVSPEERLKRQNKLRQAQIERMQRLSKLWEQEFFSFDEGRAEDKVNEIQQLKDQVYALNKQLKSIQDGQSEEQPHKA